MTRMARTAAALFACAALSGCAGATALLGALTQPAPVASAPAAQSGVPVAVHRAIVAAKTARLAGLRLAETAFDAKLISADQAEAMLGLLDQADRAIELAEQAAQFGDFIAALTKLDQANEVTVKANRLAGAK